MSKKLITRIDAKTEADLSKVKEFYRLQDNAQAVRVALAELARKIKAKEQLQTIKGAR